LIAPMVATMRDDVAYLVLMAGPGVNGREILELQGRLILEAENTPDAEVEEFSISQKKMLDMVIAGATTEDLLAAYREMQDSPEPVDANEQPDDDSPALPDVAEARIKALNNPWMKFFLEYDPAPTLAKVKCPVLAMNGTLDLQVWHNQNLPMIERAMRDAGGNVTIKRYENLNHLFQPAKTGGISEYGAIEITVDPAVLEDVTKWITLNTTPAN
jgi:fermentation-respiration switch protein FrsA (DUF1100 family)